MNVVSTFIGIHHFQVDQVTGHTELVGNTVAPNMSRAIRAISSDLPQELRFMIEVISTAAVPSSFMRPDAGNLAVPR